MILKQFTCADLASAQLAGNGYYIFPLGIALQDGDVITWASVEVLEAFPPVINSLLVFLLRKPDFSNSSVYGVNVANFNGYAPTDASGSSGMIDERGSAGCTTFQQACQVQNGAGPVDVWVGPSALPQATDPGKGQVLMVIESPSVLVAHSGDVWRGATGTTGKF